MKIYYKHIHGIRLRAVLTLVLSLCSVIPTWAQNNSDSSDTQSAIYKDWAFRCDGNDVNADRRCYIYQNLVLKDSGKRLFKVSVGYTPYQKTPLLLLSAPLGMYLPRGILVQVDDKKAREVVVERCNESGCHGALALDEAFLSELKRGRWMAVTIADGNLQDVLMKVSLQGFTAGFNAIPPQKGLQRQ